MTRVATNWYHTQRLLAVGRWGRGYRAGRRGAAEALGLSLDLVDGLEAVEDAAMAPVPLPLPVIELAAFRAAEQRAER